MGHYSNYQICDHVTIWTMCTLYRRSDVLVSIKAWDALWIILTGSQCMFLREQISDRCNFERENNCLALLWDSGYLTHHFVTDSYVILSTGAGRLSLSESKMRHQHLKALKLVVQLHRKFPEGPSLDLTVKSLCHDDGHSPTKLT